MNNNFTLKVQRCKHCGNAVHGRLDKQFCDDQCRNTYNNKSKRKDEQYILQINSQLRKNRRILKTLSPVGKSTVRKEVMVAMGYDFSVFSTTYQSKKGGMYYMCYEYGFSPIFQQGIEKALIITKQSYMGNWEPWKLSQNK